MNRARLMYLDDQQLSSYFNNTDSDDDDSDISESDQETVANKPTIEIESESESDRDQNNEIVPSLLDYTSNDTEEVSEFPAFISSSQPSDLVGTFRGKTQTYSHSELCRLS